jgi:hypothetical protein
MRLLKDGHINLRRFLPGKYRSHASGSAAADNQNISSYMFYF